VCFVFVVSPVRLTSHLSASHAFVKTGLRDRSCDRFSDTSPAEIPAAETRSLKSSARTSEICSVLTAYRLLDVMYSLEHPDDPITAPQHQRLPVNFSSYRVTIFFLLRCHDIHSDRSLGYQATRRLDVDRQNVQQAS
jgi:zona occludens toxin (predicted ATPase)